MVKRIFTVLCVLIVACIEFVNAQDPQFTQYYANLLYLNPAFAGSVNCPRISVNYRNQWPALGSTYVTYNASYDQNVKFLEGGLGLLILQDIQGDGAIKTFNVNAMYSYSFLVKRNFAIRGGFQASYMQKTLNWNFIFPDQIHPLYGPIYQTNENLIPTDFHKKYFDFSAGFVGYSRHYFFGVACHHLTQPSESFRGSSDTYLPRKYTVHAGWNIPLKIRGKGLKKGDWEASPNILFQQQEKFQQLNYGLYLSRKSIVAGVWVRHNFGFQYDSFIMLIGFIQQRIKVAYSYDLTVSKLSNQTLGAHEVSFSYTIPCKTKKKFRAISCPSF